ncbi:Hypothetical predicted protein [Mytilus galloprovincialis]|uniref:Uncharacterized protein n=1 Tax=Mytilus galloprovincialis TaxID=29158 RepID=A0A8B6F2W8_MYTGA|nr:Hypothetical predicted protein [Mytilus galloprovincialis]
MLPQTSQRMVFDKFADDDVKRKANFAIKCYKKGVKASNPEKPEDMFDAATDMQRMASTNLQMTIHRSGWFDKFADDDVKRKANFAINATKKGVKAFQYGKTEDMFETATDIAADG